MIHTINGLILCPIKYQYLIAYELPLTIYLKIPHTKLLTTIHTINHSFFNRLFLGGLCAWKRQATTPNSYFFDLTWITSIPKVSFFCDPSQDMSSSGISRQKNKLISQSEVWVFGVLILISENIDFSGICSPVLVLCSNSFGFSFMCGCH